MTPLQHEPSAHAPWMRTIFGRAFISGSLRGRFQLTERIRLCLAARWGGIRSLTALRIRHHDKQARARCARPLARRRTTARSEYKDLLSERRVVAHSRERGLRQPGNVQSGYGYPGGGPAPPDWHKTRQRRDP